MRTILVGWACLLSFASAARAVTPAAWTHKTEADFAAGTLDKTVVSSLGEVMLARTVETLAAPDEGLGMISALAVDAKGRLHVAAAPGARVYRLEKDKLVEFARLPGVLVRPLLFVNDELIAGVSGKEAGLYRLDAAGKSRRIWSDPKVTYVWAVVPGPRGSFYVATGAEGKVFSVQPGGESAVVYDSEDKNILSLAAGADGLLYAGTDTEGLVILIDPARRTGRVLYDAAEKEISALVVDEKTGVVYAATSDASKAAAAQPPPSAEDKGRPDSAPASAPGPEAEPAPQPPGEVPEPGAEGQAAPASAPARRPPVGQPGAAEATATAPAGTTHPRTAPSREARVPGPAQQPPVRVVVRPPGPPGMAQPPAPGEGPPGQGNAVYRIDRDGFVRAIFRRPVTIHGMTLHRGLLVLATGHAGEIFAVECGEDRVTTLAKLDPKDVTVLTADARGRLYVGTADKAGVFALGQELASGGTCISKVLDAGQISRWGTLSVRAEVPAGSAATIATRSGNVAKPDDKTWSAWSAEIPVSEQWTPIASPAGRFLQYRLTLSGKGEAGARVEQVELVYQVNNLAPEVPAVQVVPHDKPAPPREGEKPSGEPLRYRVIMAKTADPNGDALELSVYARRIGHERWVKLTDKLDHPMYVWDTLGTQDGAYEVRVEVSDVRSNPPAQALTAARVSRPVVVDNAPPQVADLVVKPAGKDKVSLSGKVTDATSRIEAIAYSVDTNDEWTPLAPTDGICDARSEIFSATIEDLQPGTHRIAVRVTDEFSNPGYASVEVTIPK